MNKKLKRQNKVYRLKMFFKKLTFKRVKNNLILTLTGFKNFHFKSYHVILTYPKLRLHDWKSATNPLTKREFVLSLDTAIHYVKDFYGYTLGVKLLGFGIEFQKSDISDLYDTFID